MNINPLEDFDLGEITQLEGETWLCLVFRVLNNFFCHFPVSCERGISGKLVVTDDGHYRNQITELDEWDVREIYFSQADTEKIHSQRFLEQTPRQFYAELDLVIATLGIDIEKLCQTVAQYSYEKKTEQSSEEIWTLLLPIFIAMRKLGYSKAELVQ